MHQQDQPRVIRWLKRCVFDARLLFLFTVAMFWPELKKRPVLIIPSTNQRMREKLSKTCRLPNGTTERNHLDVSCAQSTFCPLHRCLCFCAVLRHACWIVFLPFFAVVDTGFIVARILCAFFEAAYFLGHVTYKEKVSWKKRCCKTERGSEKKKLATFNFFSGAPGAPKPSSGHGCSLFFLVCCEIALIRRRTLACCFAAHFSCFPI